MKRWQCVVCGFIYDEEAGLPDEGIAAGTAWEDIPDDLLKEGLAREIAHRVQTLRKNAGYDIADHIRLWCRGDDYVMAVVAEYRDYLMQETLAVALNVDTPPEDATSEDGKLSGHEVTLNVIKV